MTPIVLRPTADWSPNGVLRGTIAAYEAGDRITPAGWEYRATWSDARQVRAAAEDLADALGMPAGEALALLRGAVKAARGAADAADAARAAATAQATADQPAITVSNRQLPEIAAEGWDAILSGGDDTEPAMYGYAGGIGELVRDVDGSAVVRRLTLDGMDARLAVAARWKKHDARGNEVEAWPPERVARHMLAEARPPVPHLVGVVRSPVVDRDGRIVTKPGYDRGLRVYLDTSSLALPPVPDSPSRDQIGAAVGRLLDELLGQMPWASDAARAGALAALLTLLVRELVAGPTPLIVVESPAPGTGKTLLVMVLVMVATGAPPLSIAEAHGDEEWRKRLTGAMLRLPQLVLIDNVTRRLDAGPLSMLLTAWPTYSDRALGRSQIVDVPARALLVATANNPALSEEIARRTVRVRLDSGTEEPWARGGWRHPNLLGWTRDHRGELLAAALTLVCAWIAEGRPVGDTPVMGSYEAWTSVVGGILDVAGVKGLLADRAEVIGEAQRDLAEWALAIEAWWDAYRDTRVGVEHLHQLAVERGFLAELRSGRSDRSARTIMGRWLGRMRGRIIAAHRIEDAGTLPETHAAAYRLSGPLVRQTLP